MKWMQTVRTVRRTDHPLYTLLSQWLKRFHTGHFMDTNNQNKSLIRTEMLHQSMSISRFCSNKANYKRNFISNKAGGPCRSLFGLMSTNSFVPIVSLSVVHMRSPWSCDKFCICYWQNEQKHASAKQNWFPIIHVLSRPIHTSCTLHKHVLNVNVLFVVSVSTLQVQMSRMYLFKNCVIWVTV